MSVGDGKSAKGTGEARSNPAAGVKAADDKAQRRAEALRANLKRRKVQQRDRAELGKPPENQD